jgi:hypothetical protein
MPSCKNDSKRKYKGSEPSPKGLGYCAHAEHVGAVKKGTDGNKWIVSKVSNGSRRWKKKNGKSKSKSNSNRKHKRNKHKSINKHKSKTHNMSNKDKSNNKNVKANYITQYNGGYPYLVNIMSNNVKISGIGPNFLGEDSPKPKDYTKLIKEYKNVKQIFIGKSPVIKMTADGGHGDVWDGNTILLNVKGNQYVFIDNKIMEFSTSDEISEHISPVGNSGVPYPISIGSEYVYFWTNGEYIPRDKFPAKLDIDQMWEDYFGTTSKKCEARRPRRVCPRKSKLEPYKKKIKSKLIDIKR